MNLAKYLNQTVTLTKKLGTSGYNKPIYATPQFVAARFTEKQNVISGPEGSNETSSAEVMLGPDNEPNLEDLINGRVVRGREHIGPDKKGNVLGWKAFLR